MQITRKLLSSIFVVHLTILQVSLEVSWAMSAYHHAETYYNILCAVPDARILKLTADDDRIYNSFCESFPHLNVGCFAENDIKSVDQKKVFPMPA